MKKFFISPVYLLDDLVDVFNERIQKGNLFITTKNYSGKVEKLEKTTEKEYFFIGEEYFHGEGVFTCDEITIEFYGDNDSIVHEEFYHHNSIYDENIVVAVLSIPFEDSKTINAFIYISNGCETTTFELVFDNEEAEYNNFLKIMEERKT